MKKPFPKKRVTSGVIAAGFGTLFIALGGWWFTLAVGVIVHLALLEYFRMAQFSGIRPATKTTLVACQLLLISTQWGVNGGLSSELASAILPLSGAAICGWLLLQPVTGSIADIATSIFGLFYLGFLPSHWLKIRNLSDNTLAGGISEITNWLPSWLTIGTAITFFACLIIVASDIGSYTLGSRFGRLPLSPISPGKTIEGALGGVFCAILVGSYAGKFLGWNSSFLVGGLLGFLIALFALVGDLTESLMKRNAGLKDSGDVLPGHGGVLDRIDSYLFTPAVVYYFVTLVIPILQK